MVDSSAFVFSGSGGQGVITAAILLAETAVLYENLNAVQTQVYGAAARGGATRTDVVISKREIFYPKVIQPHVLVCLTQESYHKFSHIVRPGGLLISDPRYVEISRSVDATQVQIPFYQSVLDRIGKPIVLNVCMLAAVVAFVPVVRRESLYQILEDRMAKAHLAMNRDALDLGFELAAESSVPVG